MTDYSNQPYQAPPVKPNSNMALASLILGILGWTIIPTIGSIAAIITGHMAKNEIKNSMGALGGEGMATAGLVLGYANIAIAVCACLAIAGMMALGIAIPFINQ
jgi:uncharacterized membrane protein SpoIIM required for sporulation